MSNSYPPGVSGNEPEIVGYPDVEPFTYAELQTIHHAVKTLLGLYRLASDTEHDRELYAALHKIEAHMEAS